MIKISSNLKDTKLDMDKILAKQKKSLQVGFFESAKYDNGTYVAQVAYYQEYGTHDGERIPPRPFFRNAVNNNIKKWSRQLSSLTKQNASKSLDMLGEIVRADIVNSINATTTPPNKPSTIARKKSSHPLIDTSILRRSVTYKVEK